MLENQGNLRKVLTFSNALFVATLSSLVFYVSHFPLLKPIADDYCFWSISNNGPISGTIKWYQFWSGDIFSMFSTSTLVGSTLRIFGFSHGSTVPALVFVLISLLFISLLLQTFRKLSSDALIGSFELAKLALLILATWLAYWRVISFPIPQFGEANRIYQTQLSEGMVHWQTLNIQYGVVSIVIVGLFLFLNLKPSKISSAYFLIAGFISGLSGYILGTAILMFTIILILRKIRYRFKFVIYSFALSGGLLISFFSPGAKNRMTTGFVERDSVLKFMQQIIPNFLVELVTFGLVLAFGLGFYVSLTLKLNQQEHIKLIRQAIQYGFVFLVCLIPTSLIGTYAAGWSAWRTFYAQEVTFALAVMLGALAGVKYSQIDNDYHGLSILVATSIFIVSFFAFSQNIESIKTRNVAWMSGKPSPIAGIADIEVPWVQACKLGKFYP